MKNIRKNTLLILLLLTAICGQKAYGLTETEQTLETSVQPTVTIEKLSSSKENGTVNPETGVHEGLQSVFRLQTNGNDDDNDFVITSRILSADGEVSAYGFDGRILFGHITEPPTASAINDAKQGGNNNKNVIAYPVTLTVTSPFTSQYKNGNGTYGDCYMVKVNNGNDGTVTHIVGASPTSGSYSIKDQAGTYKAVVTFTAVSK